jgi:SAM-dependent methyltransferase
MRDKLEAHRQLWKKKPILMKVYQRWYREIVSDLAKTERKTLELGSGTGNFKEYYPNAISSDIEEKPWLDMVFDAHTMPFKNKELGNIVMIDVLHHLADPVAFLKEAWRVLCKGGRLVVLEPYISPFSRIVFGIFHEEPFDLKVDYFANANTHAKNPWDSNQAISTILFFREISEFKGQFGERFQIRKRRRQDMVLYPMSGGFEHRQILPDFLIPLLMRMESLLKWLAPLLSFRCYIVLEAV